MGGKVESVKGHASTDYHDYVEVEDTAEGLVTFANGVKYGFYCMNNYGCDEPIEIRLHCEKGDVIFSYDDAYITYKDGTSEEAHQSAPDVTYKSGKDYWGIHHVRQIRQYYDALLGKEPLEISGEEALKAFDLIYIGALLAMLNSGNVKYNLPSWLLSNPHVLPFIPL